MRVLIACEWSGIVRDAFRLKGHDAYSCDLFDPYYPSEYHIRGDVREILNDGWDLMIAHPPCTYLCVSNAGNWKIKQEEQNHALDFVKTLLDAPINKIALENPVGIISTKIRKPSQIIEPYEFGEPEAKRTCLWLKNLPYLVPTVRAIRPESGIWRNQTNTKQNKYGTSVYRKKLREKTYQGIADAMADQWG